jgi:anti-anti-sigma factor
MQRRPNANGFLTRDTSLGHSMEITQTLTGDLMHVTVAGRLDSYWADHLSDTLSKVVRQGHHRILLDCSKVDFLSSSGISVLLQCHQQLNSISGSFHVVNPSTAVLTVLRVTRLVEMLVEGMATVEAPVESALRVRRSERDGMVCDIFDIDANAQLTCRTLGSPDPLGTGTFTAAECKSLESIAPAVVVGVGAFGSSFDDCRARFGELLSVGGTTVYQPADGTNVADYLLESGSRGAEVHVLYCLACEGRFSTLIRFESRPNTTIGLSRLLETCLDESAATSMGVVMAVEASGLIGAALRRSPAAGTERCLFAFPEIRSHLSFTAERAFPHSVALIGGVLTRTEAGARHALLRPFGNGLYGHVHAAAFRFQPVRKGFIELAPTVTHLFDADRLLGVLHLLHDDRVAVGVGESEVVRGACWVGPIASGLL